MPTPSAPSLPSSSKSSLEDLDPEIAKALERHNRAALNLFKVVDDYRKGDIKVNEVRHSGLKKKLGRRSSTHAVKNLVFLKLATSEAGQLLAKVLVHSKPGVEVPHVNPRAEPKRMPPLAPARTRGVVYRVQVLSQPDMLTSKQLAKLLGISRQALDKRHKSAQLLALSSDTRRLRYPSWQLDEHVWGAPLANVLHALAGEDAWTIYEFLLSPDPLLSGRTPLQAMKEGDHERVMAVAQSFAERT